MKRILQTVLMLLGLTVVVPVGAQDVRVDTMRVWDNATAPHSNGLSGAERRPDADLVGNTTATELYIYRPVAARDMKLAVVICPGGGYEYLSLKAEGTDVACWLAEQGVTAAVLKYRLPNGHPEVPLEDAVQAVRIMGGLEAGATGFTPDRVGIMGFSAGGHLAAMASTIGRTQPAFTVLFYPVITAERGKGHQGSFNALLGAGRDAESDAAYSLHTRVTAQTPPALLLLADDDTAVPPVNSLLYYQALKDHGVPASMHIYPRGGHGWGFRDRFPYKAEWQRVVADWLRGIAADGAAGQK